jgi:hypothetical protein
MLSSYLAPGLRGLGRGVHASLRIRTRVVICKHKTPLWLRLWYVKSHGKLDMEVSYEED